MRSARGMSLRRDCFGVVVGRKGGDRRKRVNDLYGAGAVMHAGKSDFWRAVGHDDMQGTERGGGRAMLMLSAKLL